MVFASSSAASGSQIDARSAANVGNVTHAGLSEELRSWIRCPCANSLQTGCWVSRRYSMSASSVAFFGFVGKNNLSKTNGRFCVYGGEMSRQAGITRILPLQVIPWQDLLIVG